jgi:ADP-ribose pyrophosphatase YjhB (NUDIX family)
MINCVFENGSPASLRHVVVHAIVEKDGALLLGRRAPHLLEGGKLGLPGGFLDRGESLGEGVLRELREETGWDGQVVPDEESSSVEWIPIDALPPADTLAFDHGETVRLYLESRGKSGLIPIVV